MARRRPAASFSEAILDFLRRAGTERSTARLVGEMFRFFAESFAVHRVSLFLASEETGRLTPFVSELASAAADRDLFEEWRRLDVEEFDVVKRIRAGEDVVTVEDPTAVGIPRAVVDRFDLQPYFALALRRDGRPIGVLIVEGRLGTLRRRQTEIAEFAQYLAMALANARAFERQQQRTREAEALLEVGAALTRTTELIPVLASVAQNCARVTDFDRCSVFLVDEESGVLIPTMSQFADGHVDEEAWAHFKHAPDELPAARRVLETGEPLAFEDPQSAPDLNPSWWVDLFKIKSVLYLPLSAWGERFGVLALDRGRFHQITDHQVRVARGVAAQGAVAIQLTRLLARQHAAVTRLREVDDLKNTFVAAVSHELRTPLTTIIGFGAVLDEHVQHPEAREYLNLIQRESAHLESLIANLLLTSNIEAGVLELRRDRVDVVDVIHEAVDLLSRLHPDRAFEMSVPESLTMRAADSGRLRQVFINLLQNAAKYSPAGSPVELAATADGDMVRITVTDRGPGIPPEEREVVFERFRRGMGQDVQGTGIGLYLVRALVEAHGGSVWIEPGPGNVGARFVVALPAAARHATAA